MASNQRLGKLFVPFLITGMLLTGSTNSLFSKYQDMQCVANCDDPNPRKHVVFEQPVWQTSRCLLVKSVML
ncbi:uncharacterized protein EI90DRAFT_3028486, partial [Cantharellus anzutake]|uniref:uncharacterized protein n=1 Tax=Cantharellus anzutake TaxID=1750568 RepID=UPI0019062A9B